MRSKRASPANLPPADPGLIDATRLDTAAIPSDERERAYDTNINNAFDTTFLTDQVWADLRSCYLGELHVIHLIAPPRRSARTAALIARDRHEGISIQLAIAGRSRGQAGERKVASDPGTVMVLDFCQPFQMTDLDEREVINVAIPRPALSRQVADLRALHGIVLAAEQGALLAALLGALAPRLETLQRHAGPPLADAIVDLLLLALGFDPHGVKRSPFDRRAGLVERARQVIDSRLGSSELSPEWLAARLSLSRSELYSLFDDVGGVARFIWRRRLEAAQRALLDPAETRRIGEIAFAYGFSSEAHFARAFRQAFGTTASATRRGIG